MRLSSTSSSLILATLAVSSSSGALAAPTEPGALDEAMSHSPSELQIIAMAGRSERVASGLDQAPMSDSDPIPADMLDVQEMLARRGLADALVPILKGLPVVGPILGSLIQSLTSLASGLGLSLDAVEGQSIPSLTPDQIRAVANVVSDAHNGMQAIMAQQGGLHARGHIAQWDAVSSSPPASASASASSSSSGTASATASSTPSASSSGNSTSSGPSAPVGLPVQPPNTPTVQPPATPPKAVKPPAFFAFASRMIPPVFIKAGQNDVEVSMSGGPATTFTANSSSTATATGGDATTLVSAGAVNSTSTSTFTSSSFPSSSTAGP